MEAFLVSAGLVAVAEIGDKTQLLAMILASRYRRPIPIILGILVATLGNHALAAAVGTQVAAWVGPHTMRWALAMLFLAMAAWCLVPDKADEGPKAVGHAGAFLATVVAFFLVEMGDKTQIATAALAAGYSNIVAVVAGSTLGMMAANVPVVLMGNSFAARLPMDRIHKAAAVLFALLGVWFIARATI